MGCCVSSKSGFWLRKGADESGWQAAAQHLMCAEWICALLSGPTERDLTLIPVRAFPMEKEKSTFDQSTAGRSSPWQGGLPHLAFEVT